MMIPPSLHGNTEEVAEEVVEGVEDGEKKGDLVEGRTIRFVAVGLLGTEVT